MGKESLFILLVEDDPAHVELIRRALENSDLNYMFTVCESLFAARRSIKLKPPDVMIADLNLPDGQGVELLESLDGEVSYPVILMTSYGDEKIAVDAIKAGALDYFVKSPELFSSIPRLIKRVMREWEHIASRKKAQRELSEKESEQAEILDALLDGVITIDDKSKILSFNKAAVKLFGYAADEIVGEKLSRLMLVADHKKHEQGLALYLSTGKKHILGVDGGVELQAMRKDESCFPLQLSISELPQDTNGRRRFIGTCHDLTQHNEREEQLRRAQKMDALGKLTGGIAHDYNNMLGVIMGYADLLEDALIEQPKLEEYAREIIRAGERGVNLTKKILSYSRVSVSDFQTLDINNLILEQQLIIEKSLTARISLVQDLADDLWLVAMNASDFENSLLNIVINAMHAMEQGGQLTIHTENRSLNVVDASSLGVKTGDYILLSITDTGCGMDKKTQSTIFDPFFTTKGGFGTGLGLSLVYAFIKNCNGVISVYSEPDHGSRFTLYFPRSGHAESVKQEVIQVDYKRLKGTETLLVVDDEPALAALAQELLSKQGYRVLTANDGMQALAVLEKETVDLMISDVIMPNMDGFQLATQVQKRYPHVKIQMVSGFDDNRHSNMVDDVIHQDLLQKPFKSHALLLRVRKLLDEGGLISKVHVTPETSVNAKNTLTGRTILVIDDDAEVRELFRINLKKLGCRILTAVDGDEAIAHYKRTLAEGKNIDVVFLDLTLPGGLGGKEVAADIHLIDFGAKIIVSSGNSEAIEMTRYQDYGFQGALQKNFDREEIRQLLERVLGLN